jgi:hypothetical protein
VAGGAAGTSVGILALALVQLVTGSARPLRS